VETAPTTHRQGTPSEPEATPESIF